METEPQLTVSFVRLEKPGIESATPGLQKEQFIHFTMVAPRQDCDSLDCCNGNFNIPLKALGSAAPASEEKEKPEAPAPNTAPPKVSTSTGSVKY